MQSQRAPAALTAVVAIAIAFGPSADAQNSPEAETAEAHSSAARKAEAAAVETKLVRAGLPAAMKEALGDDFGGVWYDRRTAQLHVGVTSQRSRHLAEEVAAEAGLAAHVIETPVRSTWEELLAAQQEWDHRLADLFAQAEVATAVRVEHNAVEVELGSAVPSWRRAELERAAATSDVKTMIDTAPVERIRIGNDAISCRAFEEDKAYCDPTITAGVRIEDKAGSACTAGPAVFYKDDDPKESTHTFILTAGHCIDKASGGEGLFGTWYTYPKNAKGKAERQLLGEPAEFINSTKADVGAILVQNEPWKVKGLTPVEPALALWKVEASEPAVVTAEQEPSVGLESCMSGQSSGTECGEILKWPIHVSGRVGLAEVNANRKKGDSGGPWYSKGAPSIIEGTHVGPNEATGNAVFEPLAISFAELKLGFRLLTENNKKRHAFKIGSEKTSTALTADQQTAHVFTLAHGVKVTCADANGTGTLSGASSEHLRLHPEYKECLLGGAEVTATTAGCDYTFDTEADSNGHTGMSVVCETGKEIIVDGPGCTVKIKGNTVNQSLRGIAITEGGSGSTTDLTMSGTVTGIHYEASGFVCALAGITTGTQTTGQYEGSSTVKGFVDGGSHATSEHVGIGIE